MDNKRLFNFKNSTLVRIGIIVGYFILAILWLNFSCFRIGHGIKYTEIQTESSIPQLIILIMFFIGLFIYIRKAKQSKVFTLISFITIIIIPFKIKDFYEWFLVLNLGEKIALLYLSVFVVYFFLCVNITLKNIKRGKYLLISSAITVIILLSVHYIYLINSRSFDKIKWQENVNNRKFYVENLVLTHEIVGVNKTKIVEILGEPDRDNNEKYISYFIGKDSGLDDSMDLQFFLYLDETGKVISFAVSIPKGG